MARTALEILADLGCTQLVCSDEKIRTDHYKDFIAEHKLSLRHLGESVFVESPDGVLGFFRFSLRLGENKDGKNCIIAETQAINLLATKRRVI